MYSWNASRLDPWPNELIDSYTTCARSIHQRRAALSAGAVRVRDGIDPMPSASAT
jgi:hypothetical protein